MSDQVTLGIIAIVLGVAAGFVLFVPFVAMSYRRRGGLTFGRFVLWGAALVYFWAIWTYTLLPLPDPESMRCAGTNLNVFAFVDDVRGAIARPGNTLTDPAFLQLALNVLLFVPLGFFLRVLGGRGIVVAFLVGLLTSTFIETTQLTGVWGVYPCAYRVFDVDDIVMNTTGAVVGSLLALAVPRRLRGSERREDAENPRPVTRRRRLLAMLCDVLVIGLASFVIGTGIQVFLQYIVGDVDAVREGAVADTASVVVAAAVWFVPIVITGRSIGDAAVLLQYRGGPVPAPLARVLRFAGGAGGWLLLGLLPEPWSGLLQPAFAVVAFVLALTTTGSRGLPGLLSGQRLVDAREDRTAARRTTEVTDPSHTSR